MDLSYSDRLVLESFDQLLQVTCTHREPLQKCEHLREVYLQYLLLRSRVKLSTTIGLSLVVRKLSWRELVQDKKEMHVYRDNPRLLEFVPEIKASLVDMEEAAMPVVESVQWQDLGKIPDGKAALVKLDFYEGTELTHRRIALLLWNDSDSTWEYIDPHAGHQLNWIPSVLTSLNRRLPVVAVGGDAHYNLLYASIRIAGVSVSGERFEELFQRYTPVQQKLILEGFTCKMLDDLSVHGFSRAVQCPSKVRRLSKKMNKKLKPSWWGSIFRVK